MLTGGLACYRIYATADGRHLTVGALEPKFFQRLCELLDRVDLADRQYDEHQDALAAELASIFATGSLADGSRTSATRTSVSAPSGHARKQQRRSDRPTPLTRSRSVRTRMPGAAS